MATSILSYAIVILQLNRALEVQGQPRGVVVLGFLFEVVLFPVNAAVSWRLSPPSLVGADCWIKTC